MKLNFELAENIIVHADVHDVDGHIEIENIQIQMFDEHGWDRWAVPRDRRDIEDFTEQFVAKYREEREAVA